MSAPEGSALPDFDDAAVEGLWQRFIETTDAGATPRFTDVTCFGDSVELADELIDLVLHGPKRATAAAVVEYRAAGDPIPVVGDRWIACDGAGRPRAVLRTTDVRVGPLSSVDDAFAWDEGEGDRTRDDWLRGHTAYFARALPRIGETFHDEIDVAFERFDVDYAG